MCYKRGDITWPPGSWNARVQNTWFCWPPVFMELTQMFYLRLLEPPASRFVRASEICPKFQAAYGSGYKLYYQAWRRNFGYGNIDPNNLCSAGITFPATASWIQTAYHVYAAYQLSPVKPPGCSCAPGGYQGNDVP